jgi:signal transduction histidine kinase
MKLFQKGILLIAIPMLAQFIFVVVLLVQYRAAEELTWKDVAFREKTSELVGVSILCYKAIGLLSAYGVSKEPALMNSFDGVYEQLIRKCEFLELLEKEEPHNQDAIIARQSLRKTVHDIYELKRFATLNQRQFRANMMLVSETQSDVEKALASLEHLIANRAKIGVPTSKQIERSRWVFLYAVIGGCAFNMIMSSFLLGLYAKDFASRFKVIVDNTKKVAAGDSLNQEITGKDELKELDVFIHQMNTSLRQLEDRKNQLMGMVSHDLRGPLTSLNLTLNLIKHGATGKIPEATEERVDGAVSLVGRLSSMVDDILDLDKLRAGKLELKLLAISSSEVVEECLRELESLAAASCVVLRHSVGNNYVVADRERLAQVFVNLVINAIKYSPQNGVVEVASFANGSSVRFEVRDEGSGVPEEYQDIIFLPFEQVPENKRRKGTTGLGLPICKMLVELQGGSIGVESRSGQGSTFWFTVPSAELETI